MRAERITLWGNSGSGKSTLAEQMAREFGLPVFHVDKIAWTAGWIYRNEPDFLNEHRGWVERPRWIIEGVGHLSGMRERFHRADAIIYLETPWELCRQRAQRRIEEDRLSPDRFMADGCRYGDVVEKQWEVIDYFERWARPTIEGMIEAEFADKIRIRLDGSKSTSEVMGEFRGVCG
ncbi:MAG: AAA family ATPase [Lacunisphaera sp.]